jgi:hypothetical protein
MPTPSPRRFSVASTGALTLVCSSLVVTLSACAGSTSPDNGRQAGLPVPSATPTNIAPTPGPSSSVPGPTMPVVDCNAGPQPGVSPIRRLTPFEYDNTIRDLVQPDYAGSGLPLEGGAGYDNNAEVGAVTRLTAQKYMEASEAISAAATANLPVLLGCDPGSGESACVGAWVKSFGDRAWRRPLDAADQQSMLAIFTELRATMTLEQAVQGVLEAFLQSPHFLYRVEVGEMGAAVKVTDYQLASRLSYLLWGSMPDESLLAAAGRGELAQPAQVEAQARRMLADPRARSMTHHFHAQWFNTRNALTLEKDPVEYPDFSPAIAAPCSRAMALWPRC